MIDLHTHTLFSDGVLVPSELIRRAEVKGYRAIALTDHADSSSIEFILPKLITACMDCNRYRSVKAIPGVEITHAPPRLIGKLVADARHYGAKIVIVHGESPVEPVEYGTNMAAIQAGVDILSHPGLITLEEARLAAENGVSLEITARRGHSLTNGHVAKMAEVAGAKLVLNTDAHTPGDLIDDRFAHTVAMGAGLTVEQYAKLKANMERLAGFSEGEI